MLLENGNIGFLSVNWSDGGIHFRGYKFHFRRVEFEEMVRPIGEVKVWSFRRLEGWNLIYGYAV